MTLRWTRGHTFWMPEHFYGKLQVRGSPEIEVWLAKGLPAALEGAGARIEIRRWPPRDEIALPVRLFIWEDRDAAATTETLSSVAAAKLRAEQAILEVEQRRAERRGAARAVQEEDAVVLYDADDHGVDRYVASVQETFLIVELGPRSRAWKYSLDHALELIDRAKTVDRHLAYEWVRRTHE